MLWLRPESFEMGIAPMNPRPGQIRNGVALVVNSSPPGQNGRYFTDDIVERIFLNEKVRFFTKISRKFVPKGPIDNYPALV